MNGLVREYKPKADDGEVLPGKNKRVQLNAKDALKETSKLLTEYFDITAAKDYANCTAKAVVVVHGWT